MQALLGQPWPALPDLPGRVIVAADAPLTDDELADITDARELSLCAGISRQAAHLRLQQRATRAQKEPT